MLFPRGRGSPRAGNGSESADDVTIREALSSADKAIAAVHARLAAAGIAPGDVRPSDETAAAYRLALDWSRALEQLRIDGAREAAAKNFRQRWPALVRWRDRTIANWRREQPADVAAAYELVALECYLGGVPDLAEKAQAEAVRMLMARTDRRPRVLRSA